MYLLDEFFRKGGEGPKPERPEPSRSSKGYPERRDPAAEKPQGLLNEALSAGGLHKMRLRYGPKPGG